MDLKLNADRFTGESYVNLYQQYRPEPPLEILRQSLNYVNQAQGVTVVDIGCGTGISTRIWKDYAEEIIGVEPSTEMLEKAKALTDHPHIKYHLGYANATNLPPQSADIITCSQSFHWMEPESTLKEIDRVLKDHGVLVIYDVIWPPSVNYHYEKAYHTLFDRVGELTAKLEETIAMRWAKKEHLTNVEASNYFSYTKESYYHKTEPLDKNKFIGIALSQGGLEALLKRGYTAKDVGLDRFKQEIDRMDVPVFNKMTYHYRVIYAIK